MCQIRKAIKAENKFWDGWFKKRPVVNKWGEGFEAGVKQALYFLERRIQLEV